MVQPKTFYKMLGSSITTFLSCLFFPLSLPLPKPCIMKWCRLCEIEKVQRIFLNTHSRIIQGTNLFCIAHKYIWNRNYIRFFRLYLVLFMRSILYKIGCPVCELPCSWVLNTQAVAFFHSNTKLCALKWNWEESVLIIVIYLALKFFKRIFSLW